MSDDDYGGHNDDDNEDMKNDDSNDDDDNDDMNDYGDGDDDTLNPEENLGEHFFQGDLLTTSYQMKKINYLLNSDYTTSEDKPYARALIKDVRRTWQHGVVPYQIKHNVGAARRDIITSAIKHWEKRTCLRFKRKTKEKDYVQFEEGNGCASYVGRIGGKQDIIVGNMQHSCKVGNIIHEIGHTVGFFHEQSRPDRDEFVRIKWNNVKRGYRINFVKFSPSLIDSKDVAYDYGSIMHYPRHIFGRKSREPTVVPTHEYAQIGQRIALSMKDIEQIRKLYGCNNNKENNIR